MEVFNIIMLRIQLNRRELELLILSFDEEKKQRCFEVEDNFIIIKNDEEENLDYIQNCIADCFIKIGLLPNDEPNSIGIELDNLIDRFSIWNIKC